MKQRIYLKNQDLTLGSFVVSPAEDTPFASLPLHAYRVSELGFNTELPPGAFPPELRVVLHGEEEPKSRALRLLLSERLYANRWHMREMLQHLATSGQQATLPDLVAATHLVSLNDTYWFDTAELRWEKISPYRNLWREDLSALAWNAEELDFHSGCRISPELATNGVLKKCWQQREDGIVLSKGDQFSTAPGSLNQVSMEFVASEVAKAMQLPSYVPYILKWQETCAVEDRTAAGGAPGRDPLAEEVCSLGGEIACECPLFCDERRGYLPAWRYLRSDPMLEERASPFDEDGQRAIAATLGEEAYADLMIFDSVIANGDRHLGNFGALVDNLTGELLALAPIFDNGYSALLQNWYREDWLCADPELFADLPGRFLSCNDAVACFGQPRHRPYLERVVDFELDQSTLPEQCRLTDKVVTALNTLIRVRARTALELIKDSHLSLNLP
ncbi:MAG: hypothetical protein IJ228_03560 [Succinivibrio sp.]|nr:hypothetical protein [Succinivibrio sp.]